MQTVIDKFHMSQWLTFSPSNLNSNNTNNDSTDYDTPMFESFLTFLATLVSIRTNLGKNLKNKRHILGSWSISISSLDFQNNQQYL